MRGEKCQVWQFLGSHNFNSAIPVLEAAEDTVETVKQITFLTSSKSGF